jgi:hypothetical protein
VSELPFGVKGVQLGVSGIQLDQMMQEQFGIYSELPELHAITYALSAGTSRRHTRLLAKALRQAAGRATAEAAAGGLGRWTGTGSGGASAGGAGAGGAVAAARGVARAVAIAGAAAAEPAKSARAVVPGEEEGEETSRQQAGGDSSRAGAAPAPGVSPPELSLWAAGETVCSPREAYFRQSVAVAAAEAIGRVSAELACAYPPGIPLLLPGERVSARALAELRRLSEAGCRISGPADETLETIRVLAA